MNGHKSHYKAIFFDMDGVLIDSERHWRRYADEFWIACGIMHLPKELLDQIYGISMQEEYQLISAHIGISLTLDQYIATYDRFAARVYSQATLAKGLSKMLITLKERGIILGIVTSSLLKWVHLFLNRFPEQAKKFDLFVSAPDIPEIRPKPEPDSYIFACKKLGFLPKQCLVIEDSNRGIRAGKAAGIDVFATKEFIDVGYQQMGYDRLIAELAELPALL